jgi:RHS repeat-associated protein
VRIGVRRWQQRELGGDGLGVVLQLVGPGIELRDRGLEDKIDATWTQYRRARAYDPITGRFTQPDPVGLAGGINDYGFASGDPVNYSDPFGLCPAPYKPGTCAQNNVGQPPTLWDELKTDLLIGLANVGIAMYESAGDPMMEESEAEDIANQEVAIDAAIRAGSGSSPSAGSSGGGATDFVVNGQGTAIN